MKETIATSTLAFALVTDVTVDNRLNSYFITFSQYHNITITLSHYFELSDW